jgi:hypothetical protein
VVLKKCCSCVCSHTLTTYELYTPNMLQKNNCGVIKVLHQSVENLSFVSNDGDCNTAFFQSSDVGVSCHYSAFVFCFVLKVSGLFVGSLSQRYELNENAQQGYLRTS